MEPIPTPPSVTLTFSFSIKVSPANKERYLPAEAAPIDIFLSDAYKYPSRGPLIVQDEVVNPVLLIPRLM